MLPLTFRLHVEDAMKACIAELYREAKATDGQWPLDPFVLRFGPDLLRQPALERLFDRTMLREIASAMQEREELYMQMRDLLDLLQLQYAPITPATQNAVLKWFSKRCGLFVLAPFSVGMTADECESAMERLTSFIFPAAALPEVRFISWHIPSVLSTADKEHHVRVRDRRTAVPIQPMSLAPEPFIWWFKERLVRAVKTRLERFTDNPLWTGIDGRPTRAPMATGRDYQEYGQWLDLICQTVRHGGRPPDMTEEAFRQLYWDTYQKLSDAKRRDGGRLPTKQEVADEMLIHRKTLTRTRNRYNLPFPPPSPR